MKRVQFLTNASCPEGLFGEGATAELSDARALEFERQGAVKIVQDLTAVAVEPGVAVEEPTAPVIEATPVPSVQVTATDSVGAGEKQG